LSVKGSAFVSIEVVRGIERRKLFADDADRNNFLDHKFVEKGISMGRRKDLTGGGLIGGWAAVKSMRKAKLFVKSDERIVGDGNFVEQVLSVAVFEDAHVFMQINIFYFSNA